MFHFESVFYLERIPAFSTVLFRFFFRFIPMGRPSRCPGCKELKSAHDFDRSGKNCTGPVRNNTEQDLEAVDELEHTEVACVASVSVWFGSKERPRNGIIGFGRARNEKRLVHRFSKT